MKYVAAMTVIDASLSPSLFTPHIKKFHDSNFKKKVSTDLEQMVKMTAEKCWETKKEQTSEYFN